MLFNIRKFNSSLQRDYQYQYSVTSQDWYLNFMPFNQALSSLYHQYQILYSGHKTVKTPSQPRSVNVKHVVKEVAKNFRAEANKLMYETSISEMGYIIYRNPLYS